MDQLEDLRRRVHQQIGVFRYSIELTRLGVTAPTDQIIWIAAFLQGRLSKATTLPAFSDEAVLSDWLRQELASVIVWEKKEVSSLDELAAWVPAYLDWKIEGDFSELLNYLVGQQAYSAAASKLRSRGFQTTLIDLLGITEHFLLLVLPRAVRSFDLRKGAGREAAWLTTVFYRHALRSLIADRNNRVYIEALESRSAPVAMPDVDRNEPTAPDDSLPNVLAQIDRLPRLERTAFELYFGLNGPERTLAEVGAALHCSEYRARTAVIRALATLVALSESQRLLSRADSELLKRTVIDGQGLAEAAKSVGVSYGDAREAFARINTLFRQRLRPRTVSDRTQSLLRNKEDL